MSRQLDLFGGGSPQSPADPKKTAAKKGATNAAVTHPLPKPVLPPPVPFQKASATSQAAAESIRTFAPSQANRVLAYIASTGHRGAICDEVVEKISMAVQSVTPRINELAKKGLIVDSRRVRRTKRGRMGVVWCATTLGLEAAELLKNPPPQDPPQSE